MAVYGYRCETDGGFDVCCAIGTAGPSARCPSCGEPGVRVWTAPRLNRGPRALVTAMDRAGASSDAPPVVTSLPGRGRAPAPAPATLNPALNRLPRP